MNNLLTRLREQFEAQYEVTDDGHWLWTGPITGASGYGKMKIFGGFALAHRFSYELHVGPIPDGLDLDHQCDIRLCVNYKHLKPMTRRENILRGNGLAAQNARKTHCPQGHPYDAPNTYTSGGRRWCRACGNKRARKNQARTRRAAGIPERVIGPRSKKFAEIGAN